MGVLTVTMTRLRDEIVSSRRARVALRGELVRQTEERRTWVSAVCAGFARDRAGAQRAWFGPTLAERQAAEREHRHRLLEEAAAKAQAEQSRPAPLAPPKAEPQRHETAKPVPAPQVLAPVPPLSQTQKPPFKGSRKH
jgi:hypothetical protein